MARCVKLKGWPKGMSRRDFDARQLAIGARHELEHTKSKRAAELIAAHHLARDKDYYRKLEVLEHSGAPYRRTTATVLLFAAQSIRYQ